jgi:hypothetical protein
VLSAGFYPIRGDHISGDRGAWEDSWNLRNGWPLRAYTVWKVGENSGSFWHADNAVTNGRVVLGGSLAAFVVTLALLSLSRDSRSAVRDSAS